MAFEYPIFIGDIPRYEIRGENMHIIWPTLELVMPVRIMLGGMAGAQVALDEWHRRNAAVVPFPCEAPRR